MAYFTNIGPKSGPILWRHGYAAIGVLQARDDHATIGLTLAVGRDDDLVETWRLTVHGAEVPGVFVVVNREFIPVHPGRGRAAGTP
jgi:hypothetical protein